MSDDVFDSGKGEKPEAANSPSSGLTPKDTGAGGGGGGFEQRDVSLQGFAAAIPYYDVNISTLGDEVSTYRFGAAQSVTVSARLNSQDVRSLGSTTLHLSYDVPDVSVTVAQNLGDGDPCPLMLGLANAGVVATQTTPNASGELPAYYLQVLTGNIETKVPKARLDGLDIAAAIGNFATADWRFSAYSMNIANKGAVAPTAWVAPTPTTQASFVRHGSVYCEIANIKMRVQNARITCNMARDPLKQLGTHEPYAAVPTLPVRIEATVEAYPVGEGIAISYYSTADLDPQVYARPSASSDATLVMVTSEGFFGKNVAYDNRASQDKVTFTIPDANVTAFSATGTVTAYATMTYTVVGFDLQYAIE